MRFGPEYCVTSLESFSECVSRFGCALSIDLDEGFPIMQHLFPESISLSSLLFPTIPSLYFPVIFVLFSITIFNPETDPRILFDKFRLDLLLPIFKTVEFPESNFYPEYTGNFTVRLSYFYCFPSSIYKTCFSYRLIIMIKIFILTSIFNDHNLN